MITMRALIASALLFASMAVASIGPALAAGDAEPKAEDLGAPSGTLEVASEEMRLIMGGTAGKGTLHYKGANHAFSYKSASAGVGAKMVKEVSAVGEVYGLKQLADFEGQYAAVSSAALAGEGDVEATYKNDKGVTIMLRGTIKGAGLSFGGGIATVKLVK